MGLPTISTLRRGVAGVRAPVLPIVVLVAACATDPSELESLTPTAAEAIAETSWDRSDVAGFARRGGFVISPPIEAAGGATRVGALVTLDLAARRMPRIEARGHDGSGAPLDWVPLEATWSEADQQVLRADFEEVVYAVELRIGDGDSDALAMITASALVPEPAVDVPPVGMAREYLRSELATAGIRSRSAWGARATRCTSSNPTKNRIAIHHTVTPSDGDPAVRLRGIQAYHMDSRGWCDVGYHFLVTVDGQVWEGRPMNLLGSHVGGHNTGNIGVSFVGCFHSSSCGSFPPNVPPDVMIAGAGAAVRALADLHGITVSPSTVKGHRDHSGASTSCPGDHLHSRLGAIRSAEPAAVRFAASYVEQTFPLARDPFEIPGGEAVAGHIEMRNDGSETWRPGETFLGTTEPRDVASPIAGPDWIAPNRAATIDRVVAPGETGRFTFSVRAPLEVGDYPQFFSLVQEGVAWFSDPGEGGPPDDLLQIRVTATEPTDPGPPPDAGPEPASDAGAPPGPAPDHDALPPSMGDATSSPPSRPGLDSSGHLSGGCASVEGTPYGPSVLSLMLLAALFGRRRRQPAAGGRESP